jgi:phosphoribosylamine--glycine ligase
VVIAADAAEARKVANEMLGGGALGDAGARVVLEEFLEGEEVSFLVLSDGERVAPLAPAQDHKRIGEGDTGANTGGMGAYSTDTLLEPEMREWLLTHVVRPVIAGMKKEENEFCGVLYCGLMMTARGPQVLEFNCRFGDPETQPILMRLESDLVEAFEDCVEGRLSEGDLTWSTDAAACVVIASGGYPGEFAKGKEITGLEKAAEFEDVKVFHAGTVRTERGLLTSGGRVLGVTAKGPDLTTALGRAYDAAETIQFEGRYYRRDIGARAAKK